MLFRKRRQRQTFFSPTLSPVPERLANFQKNIKPERKVPQIPPNTATLEHQNDVVILTALQQSSEQLKYKTVNSLPKYRSAVLFLLDSTYQEDSLRLFREKKKKKEERD